MSLLAAETLLKRFLNALLLSVLGCLWVQSAAAAKETFDIATFTAPPGWERVALPQLLSFRTASGQKGAAQIYLFPSLASAGSPQANFDAEWARLVTAALGPVPTPKLNTEQTPDGWTAVSGASSVVHQGANVGVLLVTASRFDRMMSVVVHLVGQEHVAEIDQFFRQLEFRVRATEKPPAAAAGDLPKPTPEPGAAPRTSTSRHIPIPTAGVDTNRLVGLFYRMEVSMQGGARLEAKTRFFLPGNRITRTFPHGGGDKFDASRCLPDTCGSYQMEAGAMTVRWDNGQVDRWPYAATPEGINLDGKLFRPARPMTDASLIGEWAGAGDSGNPFSNIYKFERGGVFTFGTTQKPGAPGRYRIQGLTLVLTFADGSESRRTLFVAGKGEPVALISVEGEAYKRR